MRKLEEMFSVVREFNLLNVQSCGSYKEGTVFYIVFLTTADAISALKHGTKTVSGVKVQFYPMDGELAHLRILWAPPGMEKSHIQLILGVYGELTSVEQERNSTSPTNTFRAAFKCQADKVPDL